MRCLKPLKHWFNNGRYSGDTLVEVLLSISILGLVLVFSFTSASRSLNAGTDAANRNQALAYAREQVELLRDAANTGTIDDYPTDGSVFCIDPETKDKATPNEGGFCHFAAQQPFGVAVKYTTGNQTYSVVSQWQGRSGTNQVFLYYQVPLSPITNSPLVDISIAASPSTVTQGDSSTITWTTTTALNCSASGDWTGGKPTSGSQKIDNIQSTSTYSLTCTGLDGVSTVTRSTKVFVSPLPAPTINFKATPETVAKGESSQLTWTVSGASGCTASDGWSGSRGTSGTFDTGGLNATTTYTLVCDSSSGGPASQSSVTVTVMSPPSVALSATPSSIEYYQGTTLRWQISGAGSCSATSNTTWSGPISPQNGQAFIDHLSSGTKNFTLTCQNASGQKSANTTVFVNNNPGFCIDANFQGGCTYFRNGISNLNDFGLNDTISSVLVPPGRREILYKDANNGGACYVAAANVTDMGATSIGNDELSSFINGTGSQGC
jgi:type II secretory pathway pseudopilin PulG